LKGKGLYWLVAAWFLLHLLLVARTTRWWGGLSFGPRILTELLPGLILLTALVAQTFIRQVAQRRLRIVIIGLFGGLALWAVFLNSYQGLFNQYTAWWHSALTPNVDFEPDYLWSWDYPQFLADNEMLCDRDRAYIEAAMASRELGRHLYPYWPGRPLEILRNEPFLIYGYLEQKEETAEIQNDRVEFGPRSSEIFLPAFYYGRQDNLDVLLSGWSNPQFGFRWSMCETATIAFKLDNRIELNQSYSLAFLSGSFGEQRVDVWLNGVELGELVFSGGAQSPVSRTIPIPAGRLEPGALNQVVLNLPDSVIPDRTNESRRLGLSLYSIAIE
jgi:hypothetical protein